jgi:hypothetical protein
LVRQSITDSIRVLEKSSGLRVRARIVLLLLEPLINDQRMPHSDALISSTTITSTSDLSPLSLLILTSIVRSPSCIYALPRAGKLLVEQLAAHTIANEEKLMERMSSVINGIALLTSTHIKNEKSKSNYKQIEF